MIRKLFDGIDSIFDAVYTPEWNPLVQLGAMGWFFFWVVIVSGIYLYIFFDTGIEQAYDSVDYLTNTQWYAGGVMRSLHRYASDALVVIVLLHMAREYLLGKYRNARWFAWTTGVVLLWFIYACGITGYWVVWDKLAQYVAISTSEWLDTLPLFGKPIARNFLNENSLSGRFFSLMIYIHIAVPLFMLFGMWIHIYRYTNPRVNPARGLAIGTLVMLLGLSLVYPAKSQGPADLGTIPSIVNLDWFYLFIYPLLDYYPGTVLWGLLFMATLLLALMPWLPPKKGRPTAVVHLENCNGCARCVDDCPYGAITMGPRSDGLPFEQQAVVKNELCLSCGICTGACPTATPFRRRSELIPGIELPDYSMKQLKELVVSAAGQLSGTDRVLVFGCESGVPTEIVGSAGARAIHLPCIGMLPPSMIDFVISSKYADGVLLAACRLSDCYFRLGANWTRQRLARERDPYLRSRIADARVRQCWAGVSGEKRLVKEIKQFQLQLQELAGDKNYPEKQTIQATHDDAHV